MKWPRRRAPSLGKRGEDAAVRALKRAGYRVLERNHRAGRYEIDVIGQEGDTIAFVEVKTRRDVDPYWPEDSVGHQKQRHLILAAKHYIACHRDDAAHYRFDVVSVVLPDKGRAQTTLLRDAFHVDD